MSARRQSLSNSAKKVYIDRNPLTGGNLGEAATLHVENMANAKQITAEELEDVIMSPIQFTDDNEERLNMLEGLKEPYMFLSDDLLKIVQVTPSLRTRKEMISMIGPRLIDPNAKVSSFTDMFRFAEDKEFVQEILKARMSAINAAKFTKTVGGGLLAGGRGGRGAGGRGAPILAGRGGRGAAGATTAVGGRGSGKNTPTARPGGSTPAPLERTRSPKASPMITPKSLKASPQVSTPKQVWEDKQKNPEICPEDTLLVNASPSSLSGETDAETVGSLNSAVEARQLRSAIMSPVFEVSTPVSAPSSSVAAERPDAVTDVQVNASQRSLMSEITEESPKTDSDVFTPFSCNTPTPAEPSPSVSTTTAAATTASATTTTAAQGSAPSLATGLFAAFPTEESGRTSASASPVPGITIAARAPQRGPPIPTSRRSHTQQPHQQAHPGPGTTISSFSPVATPNLTPSSSTANLASLSQPPLHSSIASSSGPSPVPVHTPVVTVAEVKIGGTRGSNLQYAEVAPMVSDCPQIGIQGLLSKFSGKGNNSNAGSSTQPSSPKVPLDFTPSVSGRKIGDLMSALAMKPATSTASSTYGRNAAPAPIVIPGASLSLAEMRAKFSAPAASSAGATTMSAGNAAKVAGSPVMVRKLTVSRMDEGLSTPAATQARLPLTRRYSESHLPIPALGLMTVSSSSGSAADTAGASAGADLESKCAALFNMSREDFKNLAAEDPINASEDALTGEPMLPQYSYREVVRRNYYKQCGEINQGELEKYVCDADFLKYFKISKEEYAKLARWRQVEFKKKAMLF